MLKVSSRFVLALAVTLVFLYQTAPVETLTEKIGVPLSHQQQLAMSVEPSTD